MNTPSQVVMGEPFNWIFCYFFQPKEFRKEGGIFDFYFKGEQDGKQQLLTPIFSTFRLLLPAVCLSYVPALALRFGLLFSTGGFASLGSPITFLLTTLWGTFLGALSGVILGTIVGAIGIPLSLVGGITSDIPLGVAGGIIHFAAQGSQNIIILVVSALIVTIIAAFFVQPQNITDNRQRLLSILLLIIRTFIAISITILIAVLIAKNVIGEPSASSTVDIYLVYWENGLLGIALGIAQKISEKASFWVDCCC